VEGGKSKCVEKVTVHSLRSFRILTNSKKFTFHVLVNQLTSKCCLVFGTRLIDCCRWTLWSGSHLNLIPSLCPTNVIIVRRILFGINFWKFIRNHPQCTFINSELFFV
jgi:hypothetical protein